ncbi:succinate dehydrogenase subunit C [Thermanaeromonas toyohensis ToBE]|uniref:Succinate dehydrogenase subunit C n=1 Tax=Thermanaeromonas toyohensis ToBE TaxID=698762 RepID=A0A1W1VXB6_9FIRM|nr:succinate dehydrogenase, cytochrome b556 subunit [Thermanaeromonas toyohensis]SMB97534.1 succinate dehydrogenase subunit C [Thermanaeromonas toyohensis ToBE]
MQRYHNRLGIKGWIYGGRYSLERYLYTLHRITGLGLILYLFLHIYVTAARLYGASAWEKTMALLSGPAFKLGEYILMAGAIFHAANGLRLIIIELGMCIGKPQRQEYPYVSSIKRQRPLMILLMLITILLLLISGLDFFII